MYPEDDLLPLSALQHLGFCERQWGLIHLEQIWTENQLTAAGRVEHEHVDSGATESRGTVRSAYGVRLRSLRLGLVGRADVVEFHLAGAGATLEGVDGLWVPFPVEHKHGRPKVDDCDLVQLCGQALCLEEMLGVAVPCGALFYGQPRRRMEVEFTEELRRRTEAMTARLRELTEAQVTPAGRYEKKCESCSLLAQCLPKVTGGGRSAEAYVARIVSETQKG
jgi:CRISPR-associated exonuclease Cas4